MNQKNPLEEDFQKSGNCPFVEANVAVGVRKLTESGGLLERAVLEMRESNNLTRRSNELAKANSWLLRVVIVVFLLCVALILAVGLLSWRILSDIEEVESRIRKTAIAIDEMAVVQRSTDTKLEAVKRDQDEQGRVEIVAEPDPLRAKKSPLKVRITPGKPVDAASSAKVKAVEVPVSVPNVRAVP